MSTPQRKQPVFWPTVWAVTRFCSLMLACFQMLNPRILFATYLSTAGRIISVPFEFFAGLFSGAIVGFILGCIVGAIRSALPRGPVLEPQVPPHKSWAWVPIAIVAGLILGGMNIAGSGQPQQFFISNQACQATQGDLTQAQQLAHNSLYQDAYNAATKAISENANCAEPDHTPNVGLAYYVRIISAERMGKTDYQDDATKAREALSKCVQQWGGANSGDSTGRLCATMLESTERYATQHYCTDAFTLTSSADTAVGDKDYTKAIKDGDAAVADADQCKNAYAYAYKGMAMLERSAAAYLNGDNSAADGIREAAKLLDRCISELTGANHDEQLLSACKTENDAAHTFIKNLGS